jgi:2-polyprenyl-3-methyl-5-hydroxy-6-metoxy-1,4-benzoquinol methylase
MAALGYRVTGIDFPTSDLDHSVVRSKTNPGWNLIAGSLESLPLNNRARFDAVISIEVLEHIYRPRTALQNLRAVMASGATLILSTPYHGWLKNVAISLAGDWDFHHGALIEGGHIKFWSRRTLTIALREAGFEPIEWCGRGRVPWLWKSIMVKARTI